MGTSILRLPKWFSERPKWLRIAASRLLEQSNLSENDILDLVTYCRQEVEGKLTQANYSFHALEFSQSAIGSLRLCSISDIEGVNALAPKKPLDFGKSNITVVYGYNGSGKSGYVRLLKHICGARNLDTLHRNVYKSPSVAQKASISFEQNGATKTYIWANQGICDDLKSVDIFDTSSGRVFVSSEEEVSYEPPILSFFSLLIEACEKVAAALDFEAHRQQSKKPNMPVELKTTTEGIWYENISAKTTSQEIDKQCAYGTSDEIEIQSLQQRLAEQAPSEKAKQLRKQKSYIDALVQDSQKYLRQLSDKNCRRTIAAKRKLILKKIAAKTAANKVFSDSYFEGIGSDVWKELWEAARKYSVSVAYKEFDYPYVSEDARCVLCHQTLSQDTKERLLCFESFVKGELQRAVEIAENRYKLLCKLINELEIPTNQALKTKIDAAGIQPGEITDQITNFFSELSAYRDQLPGHESNETIPILPQSPKWIDAANTQSNSLGKLAEKYDQDAKSENRDEIKQKLNSFLAKKWLSEHYSAIQDEVNRLKLLNQIQEAKKNTNTLPLSRKKGELAEELITDAFVQRFNAELKALGASQVRVELVKSKVSKGRVLHKLQLCGASHNALADILSEGENRIVSIAAFLADVTSKSSQAPFIFDDPISSLDQSFEEAVVKRLIELSHDKQVIVFTHRLSLLGTIKHFAEKKPTKLDIVSIRSADWGTGEPAPIPLSQSDIKIALNILIDQRYPHAKKANDNGEFDIAEILLKSICSDFRILVERSIENDLLCGVVQRFQRPVNTLKLKKLAKLKDTDCNFLDSLMTKYSGFEHSQPMESPIELPKPDDLLTDMTALKIWRGEYSDRTLL